MSHLSCSNQSDNVDIRLKTRMVFNFYLAVRQVENELRTKIFMINFGPISLYYEEGADAPWQDRDT